MTYYNKKGIHRGEYARQKAREVILYEEENKAAQQRRRCCCCGMVLSAFAVVILGGGIVLWGLLPQQSKRTVKAAVDAKASLRIDIPGIVTGAPKPTFDFYEFCDDYSECCNGLREICDVPVTDVLFAGMHNAAASEEDGFFVAGNHEFRLEAALTVGFRAFNMDVAVCDGQLEMIHGKCSLGTRDPHAIFANMNIFLDVNPREVVILPLELVEVDGVTPQLRDLYNSMQTVPGFTERLYWHQSDSPDWPTMRELIDTDKRILVFFYHGSCRQMKCPPAFNEWFVYAVENNYNYETPEELKNTTNFCRMARGERNYRDFFALNNFVTSLLPSKSNAREVNSKEVLEKQLAECGQINDRNVSIMFVDFWSRGDVVEVTQLHNLDIADRERNSSLSTAANPSAAPTSNWTR